MEGRLTATWPKGHKKKQERKKVRMFSFDVTSLVTCCFISGDVFAIIYI